MSEISELQNAEQTIPQENNSSDKEQSVSNETLPDKSENLQEENGSNEPAEEISAKDVFDKVFRIIAEKHQELENERKTKEEYLNKNLSEYNTENYLQNQEFKSLYAEAFNALGTNLDTKKFINLLDKYVESRIQSHIKKNSAIKENENLTDSMDFDYGIQKKPEKQLRMQDIPPEELEKYIAKYV